MSEQNEVSYFIKLFVFFILAEIILYTVIVYWDVFGIHMDVKRGDPAFMLFYTLSAFVFFSCVRRLDKK